MLLDVDHSPAGVSMKEEMGAVILRSSAGRLGYWHDWMCVTARHNCDRRIIGLISRPHHDIIRDEEVQPANLIHFIYI